MNLTRLEKRNLRDNPLSGDLNHILAHTEHLWEDLRGKGLFITGGTGFFGCWLLESFAWANEKLDLKASAHVLTRDFNAFEKKAPHLAINPAIRFHHGEVTNFDFPEGEFEYVIHAAATSAIATFNKIDSLITFDTVTAGTRHVLEYAVHCHAKKFLLTSSGAVYGKQPFDMTHISEDYYGASDPVDLNAFLGEAKRAAEALCALFSVKYGIEAKIARCFSFFGPYLPFNVHYAVGNFIRDAMNGGPIRINGDGTPYRSYLYAADLAIWLWTILFQGKSCRAYNVGSEEDMTITQLAHKVASNFEPSIQVRIARSPVQGRPPHRYVPSTQRAQEELGVRQIINLKTAIERTVKFVNSQQVGYAE